MFNAEKGDGVQDRKKTRNKHNAKHKNSTQLKHRQRKKSSSQDESHGPLRQWKDRQRDEEAEEEDEETQCTSEVEEGKQRQEGLEICGLKRRTAERLIQ